MSNGVMHENLSAKESLSLADSLYVDENYEESVNAYAAALSVARDSESVLRIRALSHRSAAFMQLKRYQEALDDAKEGLGLIATSGTTGLRAGEGEICQRRLGLAALELHKYDLAKESFQKAKQLAELNQNSVQSYVDWIRQCDDHLHPSKATTPGDTSKSVVPSSKAPMPPNPTPPPARSNNPPTMPKYQWWQSSSSKFLTISILESQVRNEDLDVRFEPKRLVVVVRKSGVSFTVIAGTLYETIDPEKSKVVIKEEKVLVKLCKVETTYEWPELFGKDDDKPSATSKEKEDSSQRKANGDIPKVKNPVNRPYASHRDWDAIERDLEEQEKDEKPEGNEAMNVLFQKIYKDADEDTRRAMIKSYQTSGGTVLSTNWDEVSKKDYEKERTAPSGVEWKTWEGDKLPMEEDT